MGGLAPAAQEGLAHCKARDEADGTALGEVDGWHLRGIPEIYPEDR